MFHCIRLMWVMLPTIKQLVRSTIQPIQNFPKYPALGKNGWLMFCPRYGVLGTTYSLNYSCLFRSFFVVWWVWCDPSCVGLFDILWGVATIFFLGNGWESVEVRLGSFLFYSSISSVHGRHPLDAFSIKLYYLSKQKERKNGGLWERGLGEMSGGVKNLLIISFSDYFSIYPFIAPMVSSY